MRPYLEIRSLKIQLATNVFTLDFGHPGANDWRPCEERTHRHHRVEGQVRNTEVGVTLPQVKAHPGPPKKRGKILP